MTKRRVPRYQREGERNDVTPRSPGRRIQADLTKQAPNNSYGGVPLYYEDTPFTCTDCGKEQVWTAEQQQWWYEVAKGSIYSRAVRCRECRQTRRAGVPTAAQQIRDIGTLMKRLRREVEPALVAAGFQFESRSNTKNWHDRAWVNYHGHGQTFSFAYEQHDARFTAEFMDATGGCHAVAVAQIPQPPSMETVYATIMEFAAEIITFFADFRPAT